jgi:hypothetical protein
MPKDMDMIAAPLVEVIEEIAPAADEPAMSKDMPMDIYAASAAKPGMPPMPGMPGMPGMPKLAEVKEETAQDVVEPGMLPMGMPMDLQQQQL